MKRRIIIPFLLVLSLSIASIYAVTRPSPVKKSGKTGKADKLLKKNYNDTKGTDEASRRTADTIKLFSTNDQEPEWPTCTNRSVIKHLGYALEYDEAHEQAKWVAYALTAAETIRQFKRTNRFLNDPYVSTGTAQDADYKGSGYDRGHLAPAADMGWSAQTMTESFYYSNMSPQDPGFNRGIWKRLEEQVRNWAAALDTLYVITGPVLKGTMAAIGPHQVSIPNHYFKAVLHIHKKQPKVIGFIMPNAPSSLPIVDYSVPIDSIEKMTGLDLFPSLDDNLERRLEKTACVSCWNWENNKKNSTKAEKEYQGTESVQCSGTTKAGNRCKRRTLNLNGRCYQHE